MPKAAGLEPPRAGLGDGGGELGHRAQAGRDILSLSLSLHSSPESRFTSTVQIHPVWRYAFLHTGTDLKAALEQIEVEMVEPFNNAENGECQVAKIVLE